MSWMDEGEGPLWMPSLNTAEIRHGIPTNLLARIAYEESRFRSDIINGRTRSSVGAIGMMQLMPQFFPGAGVSVLADIETAACLLESLYQSLSQLAECRGCLQRWRREHRQGARWLAVDAG
jgi:hypothetical protein